MTPSPDLEPVGSRSGAFLRGLTKPSGCSVSGGLLIAMALLGILFVGVTSEVVAGGRALSPLVNTNDNFGRLTSQVLALRHEGVGERALVMIGDSSLQYAAQDVGVISAHLDRETDGRVKPTVIASGGIRPQEVLAIIDSLPLAEEGALLVFLDPMSATFDREDIEQIGDSGRIGFRSESHDDWVRSLGGNPRPLTGVYALDNAGFLSVRVGGIRRITAWLLTPVQGMVTTGESSKQLADRLRSHAIVQLDEYSLERQQLFDSCLARMIESARQRGYTRIAISPSPLHPEYQTWRPEVWSRFDQSLRLGQANHGYELLDCSDSAALVPEDFGAQWLHIMSEDGRDRWGASAARVIAAWLDAFEGGDSL